MDDGTRKGEHALRRADAAHDVVIDSLGILLRAAPEDLDTAIDRVLERLAGFVQVQRSCLYVREGHGWDNTHEWVATGVEPIDLTSKLRMLDAVLIETGDLADGAPLLIEDVTLLPPSPARDMLAASDLRTLYLMPLAFDGGRLVALLVVQRLAAPGGFRPDELWVIGALCDGLTSALARRRAERERDAARLQQAETLERLRATLASSPELMLEIDTAGRCLDYHCAQPEYLASEPGEIIGRTLEETLPPQVAQLQRAAMEQARETGTAHVPRYSLDIGGSERWYDTIVVRRVRVAGAGDGVEDFVFRIRDVTEEHTRESENAMLVEVTRNMTNLAIVIDNGWRVVWANPTTERLTGRPLAAMRGKRLGDIADPTFDTAASTTIREALNRRRPCRVEVASKNRNGAPDWIALTLQPMQKADGRPDGFLMIGHDITALKRHEAELQRLALAARESHDRLHAAIESLQDGFVYFDADDRLVLCNERYRQLTPESAHLLVPGTTFEEFLRHAVRSGIFADAEGRTEEWVAERLELHRLPSSNTELPLSDGRWLRLIQQQTPEGGRVGLRVDITALKRNEAELQRMALAARESHDRLHAAIESLQDGFVYFDADDRMVLCNERYRSFFPDSASIIKPGVLYEDLLRNAATKGSFADAIGREEAWIAERMHRHNLPSSTTELKLADGRTLRIYERSTPEGGRVGLRVDITEIRNAEQRLNDIIASARIGTWEFDLGDATTEINEHWWEMLGHAPDMPRVLTRPMWDELVHPDDNLQMKTMLRALRDGTLENVSLEIRLRHRSGHWVHVLCRGRISRRKPDGTPLRVSGVGLDWTERRQAEERLRTILSAASVGTWQLDCTTGRAVIDEQYAAMLGYRLDELLPWTRERFESMVHPDDVQKMYSRVSELYGSDSNDGVHEFRVRHRDGRWIWVLSRTHVRRWAAPGIPAEESGVHIDITESKQREAALAEAKLALEQALAAHRASEQRYSDIAAASDEWFWEIAPHRRVTHLTAGFERTTGIPVNQIIGRTLSELGVTRGSKTARGDWEAMARRVRNREPLHNFMYRLRSAPGVPSIWLRISGAPFYDAEGNYAGYRGVGSDVSALIEATERAEAASQAKSRFLATMSHELRTPLTGVLGMAELLGETAVTPRQSEMIDTIRDSGEGLLSILNDILDLAKIEAGKMVIEHAPFVPAALMQRVQALFAPAAQAAGLALEVIARDGCDAPRLGDANRLMQILHNLIGNSIKFTEAGRVSLTIGPVPDDAGVLSITVEDTGIGMTSDQLAKVFDEFEQAESSTARRFGGTGLGLSITRRLTALMGGTITLDSRPGAGTRVQLRIPAPPVEAAQDAQTAELRPEGPALAGLRLMVADDNRTNRRILEAMLGTMGAEVILAEDGQAACRAYVPGAFDALLLDISMPGLDGIGALAVIRQAELRADAPRTPALAVTANAMQHQIEGYLAAGFDGHVGKPFRKETLAQALRQILPVAADPDLPA